jgi:hypothetical protein
MISFKCPHCQKPYRVKDEFAGKKTVCQACRKPLVVPPPAHAATARAADAEALAAAALADEPAAAAVEQTFKHKCQFCDTESEFPVSKAGKNAPCPDCGRIIKLPLPTAGKAKDWRQAHLPAGARAAHDVPQDVMTSAQKTYAGVESLAKAGALQVEKEPTDWARIGKIAGMAGALAVIAGVLGFVFWPKGADATAGTMNQGLELVKAKDSKVPPPAAVAVLEAAGEHAIATGKIDEADQHFLQARGLLDDPKITPEERAAAAVELAVAIAELGGAGEFPSEQKRQEHWLKVQQALRATLGQIPADAREARLQALKLLTRRWAAKQQGARIADVARNLETGEGRAEALAVIGIELLQGPTPDRDRAVKLAEEAQQALGQAAGPRPGAPAAPPAAPPRPGPPPAPAAPANAPPSLVTLWLLLDKHDQASTAAPEPKPNAEPSPAYRIGHAEAAARKGDLNRARFVAFANGSVAEQLRAAAAVAGVAVEANSGEAAAILEKAAQLAEAEKGKSPPGWPLLRLTELAAQAGRPDLAGRFLAVLPDGGLKSWGQLLHLRARLAGGEPADPAAADAVGAKDSLAQALALRAVARQMAQQQAGEAVKQVESWEDDGRRAVGYAGIALAAVPKH